MTRSECRAAVFQRACGRCERCGIGVSDRRPAWHSQRAHVNEIVPRSRGGSAVDPANAELLCRQCHIGHGHAPTAERLERLRRYERKREWL